MNPTARRYSCAVFHSSMTSEASQIDDGDVAPDDTVMSDMDGAHQIYIVAQCCRAVAAGYADVYSTTFSEGASIPDDKSSVFAPVFEILRRPSED
jgi:hypothetical protein